MYHHFLAVDLAMIMIIIYSVVRMFFMGILHGFGILVIIFIFSIIAYSVNMYYVVPYRKKRTEKEIEFTHLTVRLFMSKNEFLQTNAFAGEFKRMKNILQEFFQLNAPLDKGIG